MPLPLRPLVVFGGALLFGGAAFADTAATLPAALRGVNPDKLSGGLFAALDAQGAFGVPSAPPRAHAGTVDDLSKGRPPIVLDPRVGANVRLGRDPAALPAAQRGQAEPHLYRSIASPEVLLATFQDGRFVADGGALATGYAVSRDGGFTWTRALTPFITQTSGGPYFRATDPVAAGGPQGDLYLNALGSIDNAFGLAAVLVSRSTDTGATWSAPVVVFQSPNAQTMPDKNWLTANDYSGVPNSGRLVATWTNFTSAANGNPTGNNLVAAVSDDRGVSWSAPIAITPVGSNHQGTQPVFLPDGSLAVIYITFLNTTNVTQFSIDCKRSLDGGRTYPVASSSVVPVVVGWDDPQLRDGVFLPSAAVARQTGEIFVCYSAVVLGSPRIMVTKSADQGATWSPPVAVSFQPDGVSVMNPVIAVTPDGRTVSVVFMDKRNAPDGQNFVDHYAARSLDGGQSWRGPNLRLSELSSDIRYATPTSRGYMLGDYLGLVPALAAEQPSVAIWCDTRTGDSDPVTVRFADLVAPFDAWRVARFSRAELADPAQSGPAADFDRDGIPNFAEYFHLTNPRTAESGSLFFTQVDLTEPRFTPLPTVPSVLISFRYRIAFAGSLRVRWERSTDGVNWQVATFGSDPNDFPMNENTGFNFFPLTPGVGTYFREVMATRSDFADATTVETLAVNTDARLVNLSTRGQLLSNASQLIGSIVTRGGDRTLLVRGVGPTLGRLAPALNVAGNPTFRFQAVDGTGVVDNDDWGSNGAAPRQTLVDTAVRLGAFPLENDAEAALLTTPRPPGAYSALVANRATSGGNIGLVEIYDASTNPDGQLVNLSTRGEVGAGDAALIAGVVIRGTQPRRVMVRAVGPSLARFNIPGTLLADPVLTLYQGQTPIATNDDWQIGRHHNALTATALRVGAFALDPASLDAALLITLAPGAYTAIVTSANGGTGIALVEIYDAD